ncbi:hypothetical protein ACF0H5_014974 [Mactra antiquata]
MVTDQSALDYSMSRVTLPSAGETSNIGCVGLDTLLAAFIQLIDVPSTPNVDFNKVTSRLRRFDFIDDRTFDSMLTRYATFRGTYRNKLVKYFREVLGFVSLYDLAMVLADAGYPNLCLTLRSLSNKITNVINKRRLPHAEIVQQFYANLKRCADDNAFLSGPRVHFEEMISDLSEKLRTCSNQGMRQLISDKLVALFFLLAKQYSDTNERTNTMIRMRETIPRDTDRTTLDAVFHSSMSLNWAIQGETETAERHERLARIACETCTPCLATATVQLNSQLKNNRLFYRSRSAEFLNRAYVDFEKGLEQSVDFDEDERKMWNIISMLEMSHSLLGINFYLEVCDISEIDLINVERARAILDRMEEPNDVRRKMFYKLALGRLNEKNEIRVAIAYMQEVILLSDEGCYKDCEKRNVKNYLDVLIAKNLPTPSL